MRCAYSPLSRATPPIRIGFHRRHIVSCRWPLCLAITGILLACPQLLYGQSSSEASQIYKKAASAVVLIETYDEKGRGFIGSGFLISSDGKILTNYHVIAHAKKATVRLANGDAYDAVDVVDL